MNPTPPKDISITGSITESVAMFPSLQHLSLCSFEYRGAAIWALVHTTGADFTHYDMCTRLEYNLPWIQKTSYTLRF